MGSLTLNKPILSLTLLALALLPLASAGPGASADTLSGDGAECGADGHAWSYSGSDNESWWYSAGEHESRQCADHYDYAAIEAHDDDGEVASASLSADHANSTRDGHAESSSGTWDASYGSYGWHHFRDDSWSRDAEVGTRATGDAGASYGCATRASHNFSGSWASEPYGSRGGSEWRDGYANRCGLDAAALGEGAFAGQRCADQRHDATRYDWSNDREESWNGSAYGCFTGAESDAAGAGYGSACHASGWGASEPTWNGNETETHVQAYEESGCKEGLTVVGPDGAVLFAGLESSAWESCYGEACDGSSQRAAVVRLTWEHNPLQPGEQNLVYLALPKATTR